MHETEMLTLKFTPSCGNLQSEFQIYGLRKVVRSWNQLFKKNRFETELEVQH